MRKAINSPDLKDAKGESLKDKVIAYSETHLDGKKRIVDGAYLALTGAGERYVEEKAKQSMEQLKEKQPTKSMHK